MPKRQVSPERKFVYYLGMALAAIGVLSFLSIFVSVIFSELKGHSMPPDMDTFTLRGFGGMILAIAGFILMNLGKSGLAGSGLVLDPQRERQNMEPWSRMKGGMVKDALDEAGIKLGRNTFTGGNARKDYLPFDEQLRRLHTLYTDGIISEQEYETKKRQILENS